MKKTNVSLTIDHDVLENIKRKYPYKLSSIAEEYFRGLLSIELPPIDYEKEGNIIEIINQKKEEIAALKLQVDSLEQENYKKQKEAEEESKEKLEKASAFNRAIRASGILRDVEI